MITKEVSSTKLVMSISLSQHLLFLLVCFHSNYRISTNLCLESFMYLSKRWVYHTSYETMETQGKEGLFVKVVRRAVVPPGGSLTWGDHGPAIVLPACLIPSGPPGCSVMDLSYELSVSSVHNYLTTDTSKI